MGQWLRLHTPNAGGSGSIPGQGTRSHMPQPRPIAGKKKYIYINKKIKGELEHDQGENNTHNYNFVWFCEFERSSSYTGADIY